jgi:L-seryl-tRNA(Ser) seleniumtransferase
MLMAVEMWFKRDHDAEWKQWQGWVDHIAKKLTAVDGVTTSVSQPNGLSNKMPTLQIRWPTAKLGIAGDAVARQLFESAPRVALFPARGRLAEGETGLSIGPYMMAPGDEQVVADRIVAVLKSAQRTEPKAAQPPAADLSGVWEVSIQFAASRSTHALHLRQTGAEIAGLHQGEFITRDARGSLDGDSVRIRSEYPESNGDAINCTFTGKVAGDTMGGELDMGEYLKASWTAKRRESRRG